MQNFLKLNLILFSVLVFLLGCSSSDLSEKEEKFSEENKDHPAGRAFVTKIQRLKHTDARGPCWARYLIQQEWEGEE